MTKLTTCVQFISLESYYSSIIWEMSFGNAILGS